MFYHSLDERQLYMRGIFGQEFFTASFCVEGNRFVSEDRETNHSFVANDFDAVFFGRFMCHKAP
jgi:hypothetical protein